jgi:hypothetical protein
VEEFEVVCRTGGLFGELIEFDALVAVPLDADLPSLYTSLVAHAKSYAHHPHLPSSTNAGPSYSSLIPV